MSKINVLLGPIAFQDFEVPERISFGGTQRLAVHTLPGGGRVIDVIAPEDAEITFSGIFSGAEAPARALLLDGLRIAGQTLELTWDVFFYLVVISGFQADYRNPLWIPFRITCTVLTSPLDLAVGAASSLLTALQGDAASAAALALPVGVDLTGITDGISASDSATRGTASYTQAQLSVQSSQSLLAGGINTAETALNAVAGGTNLLGAGTVSAAIANLGSATNAAGQLGALTAAAGYLGRAATNLANAST